MTHNDYTKNILNIKDENIYFFENCLETKIINGIETKVFHGILTYTPEYCSNCGCINESGNDIIKWAFKKNCKIKIPKVLNYNTILLLDKQRFYCKHCNSTFTATTNVVGYHKQISENTTLSVKLDLMRKGSEKDISFRNNISSSSLSNAMPRTSYDPNGYFEFTIE